ncbi:MAG TPA: hypothetical protein VN634_00980 [Candidatus Limnocylindrales bacterium]|jgi:hypothetical protein|nr:hypothetical protein [Candidatus Limnocylindrales bacterium]
MNVTKMNENQPDMFHDEAAHRLEWLVVGVPFTIAAAVLAMYYLILY